MPQEDEMVMASVILKPRGRVSMLADIHQLSLDRLDEFRPAARTVDRGVNLFEQQGFTIAAQTEVGISISGPRRLFESEFGVRIEPCRVRIAVNGKPSRHVCFHKASGRMMHDRIKPHAEAIQLAASAVYFHNGTPATPVPSYYFLNVVKDVPARLNVDSVHAKGITGKGIRITMVDTGFINRVTETHRSTTAKQVSVDHPVRAVSGVWLSTDPWHARTNYWTGGSFYQHTITLGVPLPAPHTKVDVVYSCVHPHYTQHGYTIGDIQAVGDLDVYGDEEGHGTAEAANIFAVAPGATVSFIKANSPGTAENDWSYRSYPVAAFQAARQYQDPQIISCSWGLLRPKAEPGQPPQPFPEPGLLLEIAHAVHSGTVVVFSAGNKGITDDRSGDADRISVSHPMVISAGGAYPIRGGGFRASNIASSFDSHLYRESSRHVPDVVGLVGEEPKGILIMLPTEPWSVMDDGYGSAGTGLKWDVFDNADNTTISDGWCVASGTSAAAPQAAGMAALLLERYPGLRPMAVKNILENTALEVRTGSSSTDQAAGPGWDAATGFGLINGKAALGYLREGAFCPFIRDTIEDNGAEPMAGNNLSTSPDIIVRGESVEHPRHVLGQSAKHRSDLGNLGDRDGEKYVYLRIQNRGALAGSATAEVYLSASNTLGKPASWTKIGKLDIDNLLPGELRVVGPLVWPAQLPRPVGPHLIAILDSPGDPAPNLLNVHSANEFKAMVRDSKNVAWKKL
jgi:subtilisin family serine protease